MELINVCIDIDEVKRDIWEFNVFKIIIVLK